ncbi:MAG: transposase [Clostridia bacterium]|nr:transposase [Clostridia bacterium]
MPRVARKDINSKYIHVIVQGINKEKIFEKDIYVRKYLKQIKSKNIECDNIKILAYCIMNNHAHFLIFAQEIKELSKFMQKVNCSYSNFYNKINNRVGFVFRNRYYTQEILDQYQLYTCLKYIHNNPVKAGITKYPKDYNYSSYLEFLQEAKIINKDSYKLLFGECEDYKKIFLSIHNNDDYEYKIFDIKDESFEDFYKRFEQENKIKICEIKNNKGILEKFVKESRDRTEVKIEELAEKIGVSKSLIGRLLK